jgi:glycosyltransferase involved in cell wall biosynthesis
MQSELVSVIIPTYNRVNTLSRAIESVLNQTHSNLELIVIDDGSDDSTVELVSEMESKDKRIKYFRLSENKGVAVARNVGMKESQGSYTAFLDDDDRWLPKKLELSLEVFKENKESNIGLVYTNGELVKHNKKHIFFNDSGGSRIVYSNRQRQKNIFPATIASPGVPFFILSKKAISETGFFDEKMRNWEDVDFLVRVAEKFDIYFLNLPLVIIYEQLQHLGMISIGLMKTKEYFLQKHIGKISKDKTYLYKFYQKTGRDWLALGNKKLSRSYFCKALGVKPHKVELVVKILKTL